MNSKEFKDYMKNTYRNALDDVYIHEAISLMEECDGDATHFLGVVLDTIGFWKDVANIIQHNLCSEQVHEYPDKMDASCGAYVCVRCGWHKGLARCFCGWSASGGDGAQELREMGETL